MAAVDWYDLYHSEPLRLRRIKQHSRKYLRYALPEKLDGQTILDLCCGAGEFASIASFRNPASRVIGMDIYDQEFARSGNSNLAFIKGDAVSIALKSGSCDHVFCFHSFHHLGGKEGWLKVLRETSRILKPGGFMHIIDHRSGFWMKLALRFFRTPLPLFIPWMKKLKIQLEEERDILNYWLQNAGSLFDVAASGKLAPVEERKSLFFFYAKFVKET